MTRFCSTHRPNRVTAINNAISRFTFVSLVLKAYFLFSVKLILKAIEVEMTLATMTGTPSVFKTNNSPKSSTVLRAPIAAKRIGLLFFSVSIVVFVNQVEWPDLCFVKDPADVLTYDAKAKQLDAAKE